jgi:hypothetical protein
VTTVPLTTEEFLVLPNPAADKVNLRITTAYAIPQLTLVIVDSKGTVVARQQTAKRSGTATFSFPVNQLASGNYYLSIYNQQKLLATKEFMKL